MSDEATHRLYDVCSAAERRAAATIAEWASGRAEDLERDGDHGRDEARVYLRLIRLLDGAPTVADVLGPGAAAQVADGDESGVAVRIDVAARRDLRAQEAAMSDEEQ